jgi:hypothetical protein
MYRPNSTRRFPFFMAAIYDCAAKPSREFSCRLYRMESLGFNPPKFIGCSVSSDEVIEGQAG